MKLKSNTFLIGLSRLNEIVLKRHLEWSLEHNKFHKWQLLFLLISEDVQSKCCVVGSVLAVGELGGRIQKWLRQRPIQLHFSPRPQSSHLIHETLQLGVQAPGVGPTESRPESVNGSVHHPCLHPAHSHHSWSHNWVWVQGHQQSGTYISLLAWGSGWGTGAVHIVARSLFYYLPTSAS